MTGTVRKENYMRSRLLPYGVAILAATVAFLLTQLLLPQLNPLIFPLFFAAVAATAWYGGLKPGLLAIALSVVYSGYFFIEPMHSFAITSINLLVQLFAFSLVSFFIALLCTQLRLANQKTKANLRALREANLRITRTLESTRDAFVAVNRDWRIVYQNAEAERINSKPRTEVIGKTYWEEWPVSVGTNLEYQYRRAMVEQIPVHFEHHFYQAPRYNLWLEIDAYPHEDGLDIFFRDITHRKQAEVALRESEERIQLAIKVARLGTWRYDIDTNLVELDERMREIWGEPKDAVTIPLPRVMERIHPDDRTRLSTAIATALDPALSGNYEIDYRIAWDDGSERWVSANGQVQFEGDGVARRAVSFIGTALDITERKQTEATLRQSEERYRYLAESIPQLVWTANSDGILIDVNQRWSDFTGLTLTQAQTFGWEAIVHPDDVPTLSQNWVAAQQAGANYRAEGRMRRADGAYRWYLHQAVPLKNEQGQVIKWFGTATDIEAQKQLDQQRQWLLEQEQAARAEAETANRIKDEFLAVLSHELRSPLNPILGWSQLLLSGKLDATKTVQALQTIERNAKLQAQLIEDLLDVSRILRGKLSLEMVPVNLALTIEAAIETVRLAAQAKSIQIDTVFDSKITQVLGDSARLQQVIWNLLTNAVKFTSPGGQVEIRLESIDWQAKITVSDTGKGIHPDFLPYVFEYFRQADATTTRKFGGLGLGLAIVRHLVELHGGTVRAESPGEGLGATFTVALPLLEDKSIKNEDNSSCAIDEALPLSGVQVLVVDDEADSRELIAFILEQRGAIVTEVASALEALQVIAKIQPDVLVSDIGMPDMDGYTLMRQIRAMPSKQIHQIKAIALTAYAGEINQQQALAVGFQRHIAKPVDPDRLVQAIVNLVNLASSH
ncbi:PAS domain-containing protein [Scytonema sp. UIC 10036]|uniref:PAS domain-containing protein n=1 Tax=Scytonema sp. UIC 10036 TaxID=2304196 RepID=UPI0012DA8E08|nr:PAS domain-containing protein [Scytonema sp. UIC 10036]MUG95558.1 PAS domain-containing protein [Scytonema sp. UIC 10036]